MERLSPAQISDVMPRNIMVSDIDIDLYAVNYSVTHNHFGETMAMMLGPNVMISSASRCNYPSTHFLDHHTFPVSYHPSVLLLPHYGLPDLLKDHICCH